MAKNTLLTISVIAFIAGIGFGAWGLIKEECIGTNCWIGSGFLKWTGGILIAGGLFGMWQLGGKTKR
jgi:hypothetical protein